METREHQLLTTPEAARVMGISAGTLYVWRCTHRYEIPYIKLGSAVRYRLEDLERFLQSRLIDGATPKRRARRSRKTA